MSCCWIASDEFDAILSSAERAYPKETGGILLGYVDDASAVVVTAVVGPGPAARHSAHGFLPDSTWQQRQLEDIYEQSGRRCTYLGDWHTHPDGVPIPSWRDLRTLRRIATFGPARVEIPTMVILAGSETWEAVAWRWRVRVVGPVRVPQRPQATALLPWTE